LRAVDFEDRWTGLSGGDAKTDADGDPRAGATTDFRITDTFADSLLHLTCIEQKAVKGDESVLV
jgi:hypothetical protein